MFKSTNFKDAALDILQNNINMCISDETAALLTGSSKKMQGQSLQPQIFETMICTSKVEHLKRTAFIIQGVFLFIC